jgi:pantothenate kinase
MERKNSVEVLVEADSLHVGIDIGGTLTKICVLAGKKYESTIFPNRDQTLDCRWI